MTPNRGWRIKAKHLSPNKKIIHFLQEKITYKYSYRSDIKFVRCCIWRLNILISDTSPHAPHITHSIVTYKIHKFPVTFIFHSRKKLLSCKLSDTHKYRLDCRQFFVKCPQFHIQERLLMWIICFGEKPSIWFFLRRESLLLFNFIRAFYSYSTLVIDWMNIHSHFINFLV